MKRVIVEAFFPEVKGNPYRTGRGEATNVKAAISRAFGEALKQVRGKRITTIKAMLTIISIEPMPKENHGHRTDEKHNIFRRDQ